MRKLKLFVAATSILGMSLLGMSYFGSHQADAQSSYPVCNYSNTTPCEEPSTETTCPCEDGSVVIE